MANKQDEIEALISFLGMVFQKPIFHHPLIHLLILHRFRNESQKKLTPFRGELLMRMRSLSFKSPVQRFDVKFLHFQKSLRNAFALLRRALG